MPASLTVLIPCKNERRNIGPCIESVREIADEVLASDSACDGYWVYRANFFMGHRIRYTDWGRDRVLRLFRREQGKYIGDTDHAEVAVRSSRVGRLQNKLLHYTYWSYDHYFQKFHRYTTWQAEVWHRAGRRPSVLRLLVNAPLRFFRSYVVHLGFLDGLPGLQVSMLQGFDSFMKQARLWEK